MLVSWGNAPSQTRAAHFQTGVALGGVHLVAIHITRVVAAVQAADHHHRGGASVDILGSRRPAATLGDAGKQLRTIEAGADRRPSGSLTRSCQRFGVGVLGSLFIGLSRFFVPVRAAAVVRVHVAVELFFTGVWVGLGSVGVGIGVTSVALLSDGGLGHRWGHPTGENMLCTGFGGARSCEANSHPAGEAHLTGGLARRGRCGEVAPVRLWAAIGSGEVCGRRVGVVVGCLLLGASDGVLNFAARRGVSVALNSEGSVASRGGLTDSWTFVLEAAPSSVAAPSSLESDT